MDRIVNIAIIVACIAATLAAIVITTVVVTLSLQDRPTEEAAEVEKACEDAQLKLLRGEVTDPGERLDLGVDVNKYCKESTEGS
jgi:hypothetical protein